MNRNEIKQILASELHPLEDDGFTEKIIKIHLANEKVFSRKPFPGFRSLITGLSAVILCGILACIMQLYPEFMNETGLTEFHSLVLLVLSIIFLLYKWFTDLIWHSKVTRFLSYNSR